MSLINEQQVMNYIKSYGSDLTRWPVDNLDDCINIIRHSESLNQALQSAQHLDQLLVNDPVQYEDDADNLSHLSDSILNSTETPVLHKTVMGDRIRQLFISPLMVGSFASIAIVVTLSLSMLSISTPDIVDESFEQWAWNDVTESSDESEPALDFIDLVELEQPGDDSDFL